jgi:hypothetical protein
VKFSEYTAIGWKLCLIPRGTKGPTYKGWNRTPIEEDAIDGLDGAGLLHALSGTCAIDIDDLARARPWLAERLVDIDALLAADDAVRIDSQRPGRAKLIYRMKRPLRTLQPTIPNPDGKGPPISCGVELRCASSTGSSLQDVLPPTIHPDTKKPYLWLTGILGDWRNPPPIPPCLLELWRGLAEPIEQLQPVKIAAVEQPKPVNLAALRKALFLHDPNVEYPEWFKLGAKLHNATNGDGAGFDIWCDWSKGITRKPYPGDLMLKVHWKSMSNEPGKHVASGASLLGELPAEPEDFDVIPAGAMNAPAPDPKSAAEIRKAAREALFERFVYVTVEEEYFDKERNTTIGNDAIRVITKPYMPYKNGRLLDPVAELMESPKKMIVEAQVFHPGAGTIFEHQGRKFANSFLASSLPTPIEPMKDELEKIEWLFNRITDVEFREWLRQFYAHMVQRPAVKIRTAPLIWSTLEGNGKNTMMNLIPQLLAGDKYFMEIDYNNLQSDFNDYLIGKWVACLTEFRADTRGERATITKKCERWVADDMLSLAVKNGRGCLVPNYLVITASSNYADAAAISLENRKWSVFNMSEVPKMTKEEKQWLFEEFLRTPRARAVLRYYFLHVPITTFSPTEDALITKDRQAMIEASNPLDLELLLTAFEECSEPLDRNVVVTAAVGNYVRSHCRAQPANDRIGKILSAAPFNGKAIKFRGHKGKGEFRGFALRGFPPNAGAKAFRDHMNGEDMPLEYTLDTETDSLLA